MSKFTYEIDEHVAILTMNDGENRLNFPFLDAFLEVLDEIENKTEATTLIVKSSHEKIWSNGIDLNWFLPAIEKEGLAVAVKFRTRMFTLMKRVLTYPMITVAAITGHAFAAGAFLSFAHDFRFMRADRGWICLPEVDLGIPLGPVFTVLSKRALPMYMFEEMLFTARRMTAKECERHHIIKKACPMDDLMAETLAFAKTLNKDRGLITTMKQETHKDDIAVIDAAIADQSAE